MNNYSKYIETFLFRKTWAEFIALIPDEDAGKLIKAVFAHTRGESAREYLKKTNSEYLRPAAATLIDEIEKNAKRFLERSGRMEQIKDQENLS